MSQHTSGLTAKKTFESYFFYGLIGISFAAAALLFIPFIHIIALAAIIAVVLYAPYEWVLSKLQKRYPTVAALTVTICGVLIIGLPLVAIAIQIGQEAQALYQTVNQANFSADSITRSIQTPIQELFPHITLDPKLFDIKQYAANTISLAVASLGSFVSSAFGVGLQIVLIVITAFFFLRDGARFKQTLVGLSPLSDVHDEAIIVSLSRTVNSVVRGMLFIAFVQGFTLAIGLVIFGIPNATLWGSVAAIASLIPGLGTGLILIPCVIYFYVTGAIGHAIGLALWGFLMVGLIDNILSPYLYSRAVPVHPMLVLFSVFGGVVVLGPLGLLFGPIIVSFYFSLLDIRKTVAVVNSGNID